MYRRKSRTDYQIREWKDLGELAVILNTMCNEGWRVDSHKLSGGENNSGWSIFMRHTELNSPLLDREINVGEVYRILNSTLEPGSDLARKFDEGIKKAVRQELDEF
jgi:hypothetical protein